MSLAPDLIRALQESIDGISNSGLGLPSWGYLFVWSAMPEGATRPEQGRVIATWMHMPTRIVRIGDDGPRASAPRYPALLMRGAPLILFDIARFAETDAVYFGFSKGALTAGGVKLAVNGGRISKTTLWRA